MPDFTAPWATPSATPDLVSVAKQKTASGQILTPAESTALLQSGATSADINALRKPSGGQDAKPSIPPPPKPQMVIPGTAGKTVDAPPSKLDAQGYSMASRADEMHFDPTKAYKDPQLVARMRDTAARLKTPSPFNLGKKLGEAPDVLDAVTGDPRPPVVVTPPPVPAPQAEIPKAVHGPVSSAIATVVPGAENNLAKPIPPEQAKQAMDAMQEYLQSNPNGLSLGNILDAVGVSLSARGGVQRKTRLQEANTTQLQVAGQKSLAQQQQEYAKQLKAIDLQNQIDLLPTEIAKVRAQGDVSKANELAMLRAQYQNELDLIKPKTQAAIEQGRAILGNDQIKKYNAAGGSSNLANGWTQ